MTPSTPNTSAAAGLTTDGAFIDRGYGPWTVHIKDDVIRQWGGVDAVVMLRRAQEELTRYTRGGGMVHTGLLPELFGGLGPVLEGPPRRCP